MSAETRFDQVVIVVYGAHLYVVTVHLIADRIAINKSIDWKHWTHKQLHALVRSIAWRR